MSCGLQVLFSNCPYFVSSNSSSPLSLLRSHYFLYFFYFTFTLFFLFFILSSDFILRSHNFSFRLHFIFSLGCISFCVHTTFPLSGYYAVISISCVHPIFHIFFILISHCFSYFLFFLLHFIMR